MLKLPIDQDELLKQMASEAVRRGEEVRAAVRDLTLKSLHGRQLTLAQIKSALRTVTEGVNIGADKSPLDPEALLTDALAGMDDALLKAVEANRLALQQLTGDGHSFEDSKMKKALDELERYEDTLLRTVKQTSAGATEKSGRNGRACSSTPSSRAPIPERRLPRRSSNMAPSFRLPSATREQPASRSPTR